MNVVHLVGLGRVRDGRSDWFRSNVVGNERGGRIGVG